MRRNRDGRLEWAITTLMANCKGKWPALANLACRPDISAGVDFGWSSSLSALVTGIEQAIVFNLDSKLSGLYVSGSLASGDFDEASSDIDVIAVVDQPLESGEVRSLKQMHSRLSLELPPRWADLVEAVYVPMEYVSLSSGWTAPALTLSPAAFGCPGGFHMSRIGPSWVIDRQVMYDFARTLRGPLVRSIVRCAAQADIRRAALSCWPPTYRPCEVPPRRDYIAHLILTICRIWRTVETGHVTSKSGAAKWAMERLPQNLSREVAVAMQTRGDASAGDSAGFARLRNYCDRVIASTASGAKRPVS